MEKQKIFFDQNMNKIIFYYVFYSIIFLFLYLSLVSLMTFFNFLLEHDISTIENWLTRNGHDLMTLAKGLSFFIVFKILRLNNQHTPELISGIRQNLKKITSKDVATVLFLNIFFILILYAFSSRIFWSKWPGLGTVLTSMFGTILFYFFDILIIGYLKENFLIDVKRRVKVKLAMIVFALFLLSSLIAIPYMKANLFYLLLYAITLFFIIFKLHHFWGHVFFFLITFVGISSAIHGHDLMWGNNFRIIYIQSTRSLFGHFFVWLTGMFFYFFSERVIKFMRLKIGQVI